MFYNLGPRTEYLKRSLKSKRLKPDLPEFFSGPGRRDARGQLVQTSGTRLVLLRNPSRRHVVSAPFGRQPLGAERVDALLKGDVVFPEKLSNCPQTCAQSDK